MSTSEKHIVNLLKQGDHHAIDLIFDYYGDNLFGVISTILKDDRLSEDLFQECMVKIWKGRDKYDPEKAKLFTWMMRICRNGAIDQLRALKRKQELKNQIELSNVNNRNVIETSVDHLDIKKHLETLEPKYQDVISKLYFEGFTQKEAAEALEIPLGTVKTRLKYALKQLGLIYGVHSREFKALIVLLWMIG